MILKIEHLGIAIQDAHEANNLFSKLLNTPKSKSERVESQGVETHFYTLGPNKIELLEGIDEGGVIKKYLDKKGQGIHHVALAVDDIDFEMSRLKGLGFEFIHKTPKKGADNKLIAFLHPKSTCGVLIELCQNID